MKGTDLDVNGRAGCIYRRYTVVMGTWGAGLLDNDTTLDGLGEIAHELVEHIETAADAPPAEGAGRLAAALGTLLQLSRFDFSDESPNFIRIKKAVARRKDDAPTFLSTEAIALLQRIAEGDPAIQVEHPAPMDTALAEALHEGRTSSYFGRRESALFETPAAITFVEALVTTLTERIESELSDPELCTDLAREAQWMGALGFLLVLEPCSIPVETVSRWRANAAQGLATLDDDDDEELDFHRAYHANVDIVLQALRQRAR